MKYSRMVGIALVAVVAGAVVDSQGAPVTAERAAHAVAAWAATSGADGRMPTGDVRTFSKGGAAAYHVVALSGGGFAALPADDAIPPILGFTATGTLPEGDDGSSIWEVIAASAGVDVGDDDGIDYGQSERELFAVSASKVSVPKGSLAAAGGLRLGASGGAAAAKAGLTWAKLDAVSVDVPDEDDSKYSTHHDNQDPTDLLDDVRVEPFGVTQWAQKPREVYSLYIPNPTYPCGCVAVAMAQIMKYHGWPTASMPQFSRMCLTDRYATPVVTNILTSIGGVYDWASMPFRATAEDPLEVRQAVSKICYDCGVSMSMMYGSTGSGAYTAFMYIPFTNNFGYANAQMVRPTNLSTSPGETAMSLIEKSMLANLDAQLPVGVSIKGHAVVGDGYGYSGGSLFYHLIMGAATWTNYDWWCLAPSTGEFTTINAIVYNIMPKNKNELVTGRVLDSSGAPVVGATVTARITSGGVTTTETATTSEHGVYAVWTPSDECSIELTAEKGVKVSAAKTTTTQPSVTGDKILRPEYDLLDGYYNHGTRLSGNSWGNDLVVLAAGETAPTPTPKGWVDERAETTELTGNWDEPVSYDGDGVAEIAEDNEFTANTHSDHDVMTVSLVMRLGAPYDGSTSTDGSQAGIRLGDSGSFQLLTLSGGNKTWVDVAADGVTPDEDATYAFRFRFDYSAGVYSASVLSDGSYKPLKAASQTQFALADSSANSLAKVAFAGVGSVKSILGENACFAAGDRVGVSAQAVLTAPQATWLNGLGDFDAIKERVSMLTAERLADSHLLNLDITKDAFYPGYSFLITDISVDDDNVIVKVQLSRTSPVTSGGVAQPINGALKIYGAKTLGGSFNEVSATGLSFNSAGVATVTISRSELEERFFKPAIVAP